MKSLIQIAFLILFSLANSHAAFADSNKIKNNLNVISIYQIEDDTKAGFDFFTSVKSHKCGGKLSNRFRSYSDHDAVADRKFQLILSGINFKHSISIKPLECEGSAMLVDYIGLSAGRSGKR